MLIGQSDILKVSTICYLYDVLKFNENKKCTNRKNDDKKSASTEEPKYMCILIMIHFESASFTGL